MAMNALLTALFTFLACLCNIGYGLESACPSGWLAYSHSCYLFSGIKEPWVLASSHCMALGAKLVTIDSEAEAMYLKERILYIHHGNSSHGSYWTDGTDFATESEWIWGLEETPIIGYTDWYPGQPNDINNEDCMAIWGPRNLQWFDESCGLKLQFICEMSQRESAQTIIG